MQLPCVIMQDIMFFWPGFLLFWFKFKFFNSEQKTKYKRQKTNIKQKVPLSILQFTAPEALCKLHSFLFITYYCVFILKEPFQKILINTKNAQ